MILFKIERTFIDSVQEHIVSITVVSSKIRLLSYILSNPMPSVLKAGYFGLFVIWHAYVIQFCPLHPAEEDWRAYSRLRCEGHGTTL